MQRKEYSPRFRSNLKKKYKPNGRNSESGTNMPETSKRTTATYLILAWMAVNIVLLLLLLPADYMDLNNWIELSLWIGSIAALWSMRKWGIAFAAFTLIYTLSTSVSIIIYYQVWLNALRVVINAAVIVYLFKNLLKNKSN